MFIYVHIPFCLQKCTYCTFATLQVDHSDHAEYVSCIEKELVGRGEGMKSREIESIYFGGGTPSLLDVRLLERVILSITKHFKVSKDIEITIEVNPGTINSEKINEYLSIGVNRFSLGIQTFSDPLLKLCGREHSSEDSRRNLDEMNKKELNFSCDLLFALPHQTDLDVQKDLKEMLSYDPPHISTYCLTIPSGHPLQTNRPSDSHQISIFKMIEETLLKNSYIQYEISNFSKPSFISKHNHAYWNDKEFWGLGLSSHSYLKDHTYGVRFWNPRNMQAYKEQVNLSHMSRRPFSDLPQSQVEILSEKEALSDFCHTALRTNTGCKKQDLAQKFGSRACSALRSKLEPHIKRGLIEETQQAWLLSFDGRMLSNEVFRSLV